MMKLRSAIRETAFGRSMTAGVGGILLLAAMALVTVDPAAASSGKVLAGNIEAGNIEAGNPGAETARYTPIPTGQVADNATCTFSCQSSYSNCTSRCTSYTCRSSCSSRYRACLTRCTTR